MQQTETRIQTIKMVNEFKLTIVHFARPNLMQIYRCAWIYRWTKKTVENQDWVTGQPDHRAKGPSWARGPRAVGRWAFGPPGRRGPWAMGRWAAGLLLAKPISTWVNLMKLLQV